MKIGKETIFGLLQALEEYQDKADNSEREKQTLEALQALDRLPGVSVRIVQDEAGRSIFRGRVQIDPSLAGVDAKKMNDQLREGVIAVYTRDYGVKQGYFDIDPRSLQGDDLPVIVSRIHEIVGGKPE